MASVNHLLCIFAWMTVFGSGALAYKSGCRGGYCFIISDYTNTNELLNQSTAQQRCRSLGAQLIEIRNKDIQNALINFITSVYSQGINGLYVITNGQRSSGSSWLRLSGSGIGGITVNDETVETYIYGYLKPTTSGFDLSASRTTYNKGFICSGLSNCSGGVTISGQCYKSFPEWVSWYDARNRCLVGGGDLASFDHIKTNAGFKALSGSWINATHNYWIGIRKEWWTWPSSNSDVRYSEWLRGHPRNFQDCLCVSKWEWEWASCDCTEQRPFLCILENSTTSGNPRVTTTRDSKSSTIFALMTKAKSRATPSTS